jgi:hypothetical protein
VAEARKAEVQANQVFTTLPMSQTAEVALSASVRLAGSSSSNADAFWITDTGTTSRMTPHWSWFIDYKLHCIPMHIANDAVVYSVGIGNLHTIFALAAIKDLELESVNISNTYLNGVLKDVEVYMKQPEGFTVNDSSWVAKLQKGFYSMKQGGCCWYECLDETLQGMEFRRLCLDASIFIWEQDGVKVILPVFVDDITLASKSKEKIKELKQQLTEHFKLCDLGPTMFQLSVEIIHNHPNRTLHLSQRQYILNMLDCFGLAQCSPVSTPLDLGMHLDASMAASAPEDIALMQTVPYINAVGALMHLAIATHPDIAHAVGVLCGFMSNPSPAH